MKAIYHYIVPFKLSPLLIFLRVAADVFMWNVILLSQLCPWVASSTVSLFQQYSN
jgi:hypothetical protein